MPDFTPTAATTYTDNGQIFDRTTHIVTSAFARLVFTTTATSVDVSYYAQGVGINSVSGNAIGVYVDGVYHGHVLATWDSGAGTSTYALPAGTKEVSFVNSPVGASAEPLDVSTYSYVVITNLAFNAAFTQTFPSSNKKLIVCGDSVLAMYGVPVHQKAWTMQLRSSWYGTGQVAIDQRDAGALSQDTVNGTAVTNMVNRITALRASSTDCTIWFEWGTNPGTHNTTNFQTAVGTVIDAVHTAHPDAKIVWQTFIEKSGQTPGTQQYRDFANVGARASGRSAFTTVLRGEYFMDIATDYTDGLHPNNTGHDKYAAWVLDYLAAPHVKGRVSLNR